MKFSKIRAKFFEFGVVAEYFDALNSWSLNYILGVSDDSPFFTPIPSHLHPCPALNCPKYLESEDILPHLMEIHNFVNSIGNEHSNVLECGLNATNIFRPENAAWSPTLLGKSF